MQISGNFLRSPSNTKRHSCLLSAHPAPRSFGRYRKRGDKTLSLVVGFNSGDNPFDQTHYKFDIRRMPDRPRLKNTMDLARYKGIETIAGWVFLDDSPMGMANRRVVIDQAAKHIKPDIWIVALEANEYLTWNQHNELGMRLRSKVRPKVRIYQHLMTDWWSYNNKVSEWEEATWCNGIALQVKEDVMDKIANFRAIIHTVRPDVDIIYGEGDADWTNDRCNLMAQSLYDAGLVSGSLHGLINF